MPEASQSAPSVHGPRNIMNRRSVSAPYFATYSSGVCTLPRDFDILRPPKMIVPWFCRRSAGSSNHSSPRSRSALQTKRMYSRCRIACSIPPVYCATGSQRRPTALFMNPGSIFGPRYRYMYQDESTNVSIVSLSRFAGFPQRGQVVFTNDATGASAEPPRPVNSTSRGSTIGSWSYGTGTWPQESQYTIGIGVPQ